MIEAPAAPSCARGIEQADRYPLWSLFDMLQNYLPLYQVARDLQELLGSATLMSMTVYAHDAEKYTALLATIQKVCEDHGLSHTAEMATRAAKREAKTYVDIRHELIQLNDSLTIELGKEAIFRIPPERKDYYERDELFGPVVATAFPSCARDIQKAGSCYALAQEDGCAHHLMLVLERGLNALAGKLNVPYQRTNWDPVIRKIQAEIGPMPKSAQKDFYVEVNAQFGFLKDAYRNHAEHARDDHYDMPKALHIVNHVRAFMQALAKGGLTE